MPNNYKFLNLSQMTSRASSNFEAAAASDLFRGTFADNEGLPRIGFTARPFATVAAQNEDADTAAPIVGDFADLYGDLHERLSSFVDLKEGWNGYDAEVPDDVAVFWAQKILKTMLDENINLPTDVVPSAEGGAGIFFRKGEKYADFECFNNGEIWAITSADGASPMVWQVENTDDSLKKALKNIVEFFKS